MADDAAAVLSRLQGVWFPVRWSVGGQLCGEHQPTFPTKIGDPWLMTIRGDQFHVTAHADYYATGGRLRVDPAAARLVFVYPNLPFGCDVPNAYRLSGDELFLHCGGLEWCDSFGTTDTWYVRVAPEPTPEMAVMIDEAIRYQERCAQHAAQSTSS
jgi:hypothetical protein